jgi:hypothetical protein
MTAPTYTIVKTAYFQETRYNVIEHSEGQPPRVVKEYGTEQAAQAYIRRLEGERAK